MMKVVYFLFIEIIDSSFSENVPYSRNFSKVAMEQHFFPFGLICCKLPVVFSKVSVPL